jgi:signal transduction histidine kinase
VSDRGPGIPEDKLKEVFEPFYTSRAQGMGMGLSIARTIIEAHHGLIWAKNRAHGGASFRIKLPLERVAS